LPEGPSQRIVELSERFADGLISWDELRVARGAAWFEPRSHAPAAAAFTAVQPEDLVYDLGVAVFGQSIHAKAPREVASAREQAEKTPWWAFWNRGKARSREEAFQCHLLRDIVGNPFQPVTLDPGWLTPTVKVLAEAAYEERALPLGELDAARLGVLADALEDAGCGNADLLGHLRGPGPHVRGCWALDLLLGRS
jgi:hypothetical protein